LIRFLSTNSLFTMTIKIEELTRSALDAFWDIIAKQFPHAKSGDLSPLATVQLDTAAENAVSEWIDNNARPAPTEGPWFVDRQSPYSALCIKPYPGPIVCDVHGTDAEAEANARLLAAAPDILAACEGMCGLIERDKRDCEQIDLDVYEKAESACLSAIAKASGVEAEDRKAA
jgi:hypothetical protein